VTVSRAAFYPPSGVYADSYEKDMRVIKTRTQRVLAVVGLLLLFALPLLPGVSSAYYLRLVIGAAIAVIACLGLNILTGYCGQLNVGQSAFVMVGAIISGLLDAFWGWPLAASVLPAGLGAAAIGAVFGIPSVRLKGLYLALTTLGAQVILGWIALYGITVTAAGFEVRAPSLFGVTFNTPHKFYWVAISFTAAMTFFARNLMRSRIGRAFIAIRDNDRAAEGMGIDIFRYKLLAFAICTFYAGVSGALLVHFLGWMQLESFSLQDSVWYLTMVIVGGLGSIEGTVFGVVFITALKELVLVVGPEVQEKLTFLPTGAPSGLLLMTIGGIAITFGVLEPRGMAHRWSLIKAFYRLWPFGY
jgi:branched-chain amino acid transport system permease protein